MAAAALFAHATHYISAALALWANCAVVFALSHVCYVGSRAHRVVENAEIGSRAVQTAPSAAMKMVREQ